MLIAIGDSEATAAPERKTYTANLALPGPFEVTAGVDETFTLTVTNTSASTPLGAVNIEIPVELEKGTEPAIVTAPDGTESWTAAFNETTRTVELRAAGASGRLDPGEKLVATFGAIGLQEFIGSNEYKDYKFTTAATQANWFSGLPGNRLSYVPVEPSELVVWVYGVAKRCTAADCDLTQAFDPALGGSFSLSGTCELDDCGVIAVDLISDNLIEGSVVYVPAPGSTDVIAFLTLPKDQLTKSASQYTFDLFYLLDVYDDDDNLVISAGELKEADLSKCRRDGTNCIEKIERTKTDVTWIFRVDSEDPRMDWK